MDDKLLKLFLPGLRMYKGDYVVQLITPDGKLYNEPYNGQSDIARACGACVHRAVEDMVYVNRD